MTNAESGVAKTFVTEGDGRYRFAGAMPFPAITICGRSYKVLRLVEVKEVLLW